MKKNISPHVQIYKFPITAISSITNRVTGLGLTGFFIIGGIGNLFNINYKEKYNNLKYPYQKIINYSFYFPLSYHTFGGIRHFIWDKYPHLLNNKSVAKSSIFLLGFSVCNTFLLDNLFT